MAVFRVGTPVTVLERGTSWSRIQVGGLTGYMMNQFLIGGSIPIVPPSATGNAVIWSANGLGVRLRTGPSKSHSIIGVYSVGTQVTVLEKGAIWDKIQVGSRVGYMMNEFLHYFANTTVTSVVLNNTSPAVDDVLVASAISPAGATVNYSWLVGGVERGTASSYKVMAADAGKKIQLKVTGTGDYTGSATSAETAAVITATTLQTVTMNITPSSEAPAVGDTLQVVSTDPANATVGYRWIVNGNQISTAASYKVAAAGDKIQLIVSGTGAYTGSVTVTFLDAVASAKLTGLAIKAEGVVLSGSDAPNLGDTLTAAPTPSNASVNYIWFVNLGGGFTQEGTGATFAVTNSTYVGKPIMLRATHVTDTTNTMSVTTGNVTGLTKITGVTLNGSEVTNPVYRGTTGSSAFEAVIAPTTGILPAQVNYAWGSGAATPGAKNYTVGMGDIGTEVTVVVTGDGLNTTTSGTVQAKSGKVKGLVQSVTLTPDTTLYTLTAKVTGNNGADITAEMDYTWTGYGTASGAVYTLDTNGGDFGLDITVKATPKSTSNFVVETPNSNTATGKIDAPISTLTSVTISGTPQLGETLSASTNLTDAEVEYEWLGSSGVVVTGKTYPIIAGDYGTTVTVTATNKANSSNYVDNTQVISIPIISNSGNWSATAINDTLSIDVNPSSAVGDLTFTWASDISIGTTGSSYQVVGGEGIITVTVKVTSTGYVIDTYSSTAVP